MLALLIIGSGVELSVVGCVLKYAAKLERPSQSRIPSRALRAEDIAKCPCGNTPVEWGLVCRLRRSHQQGTHVGVSGLGALSRVPGNGAFELRGMKAG